MNTSELLINQSTNEESDSIQIREDTTALKVKGSKKMPIIPILLIAVSITLVSGILFVSFTDNQTIRKFNPLYKEVPKSLGDIKTDAKNLILYYRDYKQKADTDILRLLESIKSINQTEYEYWKYIKYA